MWRTKCSWTVKWQEPGHKGQWWSTQKRGSGIPWYRRPTESSPFLTTRPPAAGFGCATPGRGNQDWRKTVPYSTYAHTVFIQHRVENWLMVTHQRCDSKQLGQNENSMCKHANVHAHVMSTHTPDDRAMHAVQICMYTVKQSELGNWNCCHHHLFI